MNEHLHTYGTIRPRQCQHCAKVHPKDAETLAIREAIVALYRGRPNDALTTLEGALRAANGQNPDTGPLALAGHVLTKGDA